MSPASLLERIKSTPRIPELLFAAVMLWLFATGQGWSFLLADGDTGWHIRNGEQIIDTRIIPRTDTFAFGSAGHPWFSWEWLSDVLFGALFRMGGLKAVALFCGIVIAVTVSVLFRHMIWRSVGVCIALPLTLLMVGASSVHYLARPHVIGLLFFAIAAWMIDRDRTRQWPWIWSLPLLFVIWTNCHGSFLAGLAMLGMWSFEAVIARSGSNARPAILLGLSSVATFCNPYGWHLHIHAIEYLRSSWIQGNIEEFQSPRFRSESMLYYEILLIAGISSIPWFLRRKQLYPCCAILLWVHESLAAVRHVPLYCLAACPFIASWLQYNWDRRLRCSRPRSFLSALDSINLTWKPWSTGVTVWPWVLCLLIAAISGQRFAPREPLGFPENRFPVNLVNRNLGRMTRASEAPLRIFSSDQWSDYLIFRLHPAVRIFFDGRSDFFGPWRGATYQLLIAGGAESPAILDSEKVEFALLPKDWALTGILSNDRRWQVADADGQAVLFVRDPVKSAFSPNQNLRGRR